MHLIRKPNQQIFRPLGNQTSLPHAIIKAVAEKAISELGRPRVLVRGKIVL
jgi:hypothetical protein